MTGTTQNRIVATVFAVLAVGIVIAARQLPPGIGNLPGPGFFPATLGFLMLVFCGMLAAERAGASSVAVAPGASDADGSPAGVEPHVAAEATQSWTLPVVAFALMVGYLASWEYVPFLVRTPLLVIVLMRLAAASWRATIMAALLFPVFLYAIFALGLRVDLG
jgi:hypothetical protein